VLIAGCSAGSGKDLDESGRPIGEGPDPGDAPTLANIQARVFSPICIQCHIGAGAPQGLRLDEVNAFNDLVGVRSREVDLLRVDPFNPDDSYLVRKIEGTASAGGQMPLGGPVLPDEDIMLIRQWVLEGAMNTPSAAAGQSKVQAVQVGRSSIRVAFTQELDASTVHRGTVVLIRSDGVAVRDYTVSIAPMNARAVLLQLSDGALDGTVYRLALNSDDAVRLLDLSGHPVETYQMEFR
jgi:mono/diheme cytochrome c family protein